MGKLVLTRRAGESVIVREANGDEWLVTSADGKRRLRVKRPSGFEASFNAAEVIHFAGGSLELRPARCPSQAILAFDFPRDVTILRTEIA
jgi:hypothetical protein